MGNLRARPAGEARQDANWLARNRPFVTGGNGSKPADVICLRRSYLEAGANTANIPAYGFTMNAGAP